MTNGQINSQIQTIAATTTSQRLAYDVSQNTNAVWVWNASAEIMHVASGSATVVATTASNIIPANSGRVLFKDTQDTHFAARTAASTGDIFYHSISA